MINLNIEGTSWPEVTKQLAELISNRAGDSLKTENSGNHNEDLLKEEVAMLQRSLTQSEAHVHELKADLAAANERIAELTQLLNERQQGDGENPTPSSATTAVTETTAPTTGGDPAPTEPEPNYDMVTVRSALAAARGKGVNITELLKPFGGRFPAVDARNYPAVMKAVEKALAEKGVK